MKIKKKILLFFIPFVLIIFIISNFFSNKNKKPLIVSHIDGGICSQIYFYSRGKYLEELGYNVKWDLSWYKKEKIIHPNDYSTRNFELTKAFPDIKIKKASKFEIRKCKKNVINTDENNNKIVDIVKPNSYLVGYSDRNPYPYLTFLQKNFKPDKLEFDEQNKMWFELINKDTNSCGVHVRRGDLSTPNLAYGIPPTAEYFIKVIEFLHEKNSDISFYFFSEELDWIKDNIIPKLSSDIKYHIVNANTASRGYLDLFLLSRCKYIIGSHGSFGAVAQMLSENSILISYHENKNKEKKDIVITNK